MRAPRGIKSKTYFKRLMSRKCQHGAEQKGYQTIPRFQEKQEFAKASVQTTRT